MLNTSCRPLKDDELAQIRGGSSEIDIAIADREDKEAVIFRANSKRNSIIIVRDDDGLRGWLIEGPTKHARGQRMLKKWSDTLEELKKSGQTIKRL